MASQQAYQAYSQNKGTLIPGQAISVNKFNVQVERYLSQGGFAHVYLVRTATPVYNTTHHVLKRIAVANDAMLKDVKKEVDIMRLLKGHPNIVHLIDAAWHKMPDGTYEVFILMEFCPGGGIIDMMNRRLRERLTEAEILQIFVDVCEGVAYMHNSRPPLLHRDLKVENILQSSPTSFKLCDFGSASVVSRPPTTTQEIRALEADLNRHTTLQYRAPEMVDPYSRRPVDEKSDVWALGVLLYKLCYYTTPFEEHGPLAILNVQYRIPPYPVYSDQMNQLIGSMLQEHGVTRPSVFELLTHVHSLRGTKSRFQYTIPPLQPLSPRHAMQAKPPPPSNHVETSTSPALSVPVHNRPSTITGTGSPSKGQGIQARDKVLEAIAPMRRGRPNTSKESESSVKPDGSQNPVAPPKIGSDKTKIWLDPNFVEDDGAWKAKAPIISSGKVEEAWKIAGNDAIRSSDGEGSQNNHGFGDNFAEKLWSTFESKPASSTRTKDSSESISTSQHAYSGSKAQTQTRPERRPSSLPREKDAFAGLGLGPSSEKPAPTLGEARKLRTGLAVMNTNTNGPRYGQDRAILNTSRLTPSPRVSPKPQLQPRLSPKPPSMTEDATWNAPPYPSGKFQPDGLAVEARFPSLEELDATFSPEPKTSHPDKTSGSRTESGPLNRRNSNLARTGTTRLVNTSAHSRPHVHDGVRSEQVTGVAMRESRGGAHGNNHPKVGEHALSTRQIEQKDIGEASLLNQDKLSSRPSLTRKHRSSITIKDKSHSAAESASPSSVPSTAERLAQKTNDWLTGEDDNNARSTSLLAPTPHVEMPVLRESPSKRASFIQRSPVLIPDAVTVTTHEHARSHQATPPPSSSATVTTTVSSSPTMSRFIRAFPPIDTSQSHKQDTNEALTENWSPVATRTSFKPQEHDSSSSADEGPEDADGHTRPIATGSRDTKRVKRKGRQSSVHDLVDLWGGGFGSKDKDREIHGTRPNRNDTEGLPKPDLRATVLSIPPIKPDPKLNPASPPPLLPTPVNSANQRSDFYNRPTSRSPMVSPSPSRSRPQSMIMFPSKSTEGQTISSPTHSSNPLGLRLQEGPQQQRRTRRTSISDIVQRYEGIGKPKSIGLTRPPSPPRSANKVGSVMSEDNRRPRGQRKVENVGPALNPQVLAGGIDTFSKDPAEMSMTIPIPLRTSSIAAPVPVQHGAIHKEPDPSLVRSRKSSFRPDMAKPAFPPPMLADESILRSGDARSSSPERPYQGVGKLIDQWQRKTAEAEAETSRTAVGSRRGVFLPGRGGATRSAVSRGQ